nr:hypothetical protein [uncultured Dyadobacter sp.]
MKKNLFACLLCIASIAHSEVYGQKVSITELMDKSYCKEFMCYQNFITEKGFSFMNYTDGETGKYYTYQSDLFTAKENGVSLKNISTVGFLKTGSVTSGIRKSDKAYWKVLMDELQSKKFKSRSTDNEDGDTVRVWYRSPSFTNFEILITIETVHGHGTSWPSYDVTIRRDQ